MLRIALTDGDPAIRAGRRLMIESEPSFQLVFEEADAQIALERVPDLLVDVIVLDHRLKGFDGLELARRLVEVYSTRNERTPTIVITGSYATPELVLAAVRAGASDVVTQDAPMSELLTAISNASKNSLLPDSTSFFELIKKSDYVAEPDPMFMLRRSQLNQVQETLLMGIEENVSLESMRSRGALSSTVFKSELNQLLISLHMATFDQLRLALHDAKLG